MCLHYHLDGRGRLHPCSKAGAGMGSSSSSAAGGAADQQQAKERQYGIEQSNVQLGVMVRKGVGGTCPLRYLAVWQVTNLPWHVGLSKCMADRCMVSMPCTGSNTLCNILRRSCALFAGRRLGVWRVTSQCFWMAYHLLKKGCRLLKHPAQLQRSQ